MKFDIEIVCTLKIIMGYISLDYFFFFFLRKGPTCRGNPPLPQAIFFLRFYEKFTEYFMIELIFFFSEKVNDAIFTLIKVHFGGLRAP